MPRGSRPSWAWIAASSAGSITARLPCRAGSTGASISAARSPVPSAGRRPGRPSPRRCPPRRRRRPASDVGGVGELGLAPPAACRPRRARRTTSRPASRSRTARGPAPRRTRGRASAASRARGRRCWPRARRSAALRSRDVRALLEVGAQRRGVGDGQHREHEDQDRGAAGEPGPRERAGGAPAAARAGGPGGRAPRRRAAGPRRAGTRPRTGSCASSARAAYGAATAVSVPGQPWYRGKAPAPA